MRLRRSALRFCMSELPADPTPPPPRSSRLGLSWLDKIALQNFVDNDPALWEQLVAQVTRVAQSLGDVDDREEARVRLLSRAIATERARQIILSDRLDVCLKRRDDQAVALLERSLLGATKRLTLLLAEHRKACERGPRRVSISVGSANVLVAPR